MEQHGTALAPLAALDDLRPLAAQRWSYLSAHLSLRPATEEVGPAAALRWRAWRERAAEAGAPEVVLAVVDEALEGAQRRGSGLSVVAPAGGPEAHVSHLPMAPPQEIVRWELVPALVPLIAVRQRSQPHVVALVDRVGADLGVGGVDGDSAGGSEWHAVEGEDHPVRKVAPGGWSQRRYQQRAEETWHRNMSDVADEVTGLAARSRARLVAVGGDERAVGLLTSLLPASVRDLVRPIAVTRAADGSIDHLAEQVTGAVDAWTGEQLAETLALYRQELGQRDRATAGAAATLEALRAARVGVVLVQLGLAADEDQRASVGPEPEQVGLDAGDLGDLGHLGGELRSAPLADAAVTAALATGADVRVVPDGEVPEGIGALLRW